jgi:hypothetical protein
MRAVQPSPDLHPDLGFGAGATGFEVTLPWTTRSTGCRITEALSLALRSGAPVLHGRLRSQEAVGELSKLPRGGHHARTVEETILAWLSTRPALQHVLRRSSGGFARIPVHLPGQAAALRARHRAARGPRPDCDHAGPVAHVLDDQGRQPGKHNSRQFTDVTRRRPCQISQTVAQPDTPSPPKERQGRSRDRSHEPADPRQTR